MNARLSALSLFAKWVFAVVLAFVWPISSWAQVKIGDNPTTIDTNPLLELESTDKGILIPRVALTATNNSAPLSAHVVGMLVYNTATDGTAPNNVTPGSITKCPGTNLNGNAH